MSNFAELISLVRPYLGGAALPGVLSNSHHASGSVTRPEIRTFESLLVHGYGYSIGITSSGNLDLPYGN